MTTTPTVGIPYSRSSLDEAGRYWVHCPKCDATFRGVGATEDKITKSATLEYAIHYERTHTADDPFAGIVDVTVNDGWDNT